MCFTDDRFCSKWSFNNLNWNLKDYLINCQHRSTLEKLSPRTLVDLPFDQVSQYSCDYINKAPAGCLQYFFNPTGTGTVRYLGLKGFSITNCDLGQINQMINTEKFVLTKSQMLQRWFSIAKICIRSNRIWGFVGNFRAQNV